MNKTFLLSVLSMLLSSIVFAQVQLPNSTTTNLFPPVGKVGIGTINPSEALDIKNGTILLHDFKDTVSRYLVILPNGKLSPGPIVGTSDDNVADITTTTPDKAPYWSLAGNTIPAVLTTTVIGSGNNVSNSTRDFATFGINKPLDVTFYTGGGGVFRMTKDAELVITKKISTPTIISNTGTFSGQVSIQKLAIGGTQFGPTSALTVNGKIAAVEVNLVNGNFPDYVFEKNYNLMSLKELNAYILKNKRLPGMPSAENVAKDGMNVNEINTKLVEKVEELTLYILDLQKQIDELKQK